MADNNFQIITKADLESLNISQSVQSVILEGVSLENFSLKDLNQLVNNLKNLIEKVMINNQEESKKGRVGYSYSFSKMRKNTFKQIMLVGALLVFRIRQFLLQESIIFSLGATDEKGQLFERKITQDELFEKTNKNSKRLNLRSSLSSNAILLSKSLEKYNMDNFSQVGKLNLWPQIQELAFEGPAIKDSGSEIIIDGTYFYQKDSLDKNVYIRYAEGKKQIKQYYYQKGTLNYFNRGWLYEWYMSYLQQDESNEEKLMASLQKGSIAPIMSKMDAIPGYKGGDFIDAEGRQTQAKYYNQQMITFTSIITVLKNISEILNEWQNKNVQGMAEEFAKLFTDDATAAPRLNNTYNEIINNQLLNLLGNDRAINVKLI